MRSIWWLSQDVSVLSSRAWRFTRSIEWLSQDAFDKGLVQAVSCLSESFMQALRFFGAVFLFFVSVHPSVSSVLVDFQVAQPPPVPKDTQQCTIEILQSVIAMTILPACQIINPR